MPSMYKQGREPLSEGCTGDGQAHQHPHRLVTRSQLARDQGGVSDPADAKRQQDQAQDVGRQLRAFH